MRSLCGCEVRMGYIIWDWQIGTHEHSMIIRSGLYFSICIAVMRDSKHYGVDRTDL